MSGVEAAEQQMLLGQFAQAASQGMTALSQLDSDAACSSIGVRAAYVVLQSLYELDRCAPPAVKLLLGRAVAAIRAEQNLS